MALMSSAFVSASTPDKDPYGERFVTLYLVQYRYHKNGDVRAQFLVAARDEREVRWHLQIWHIGFIDGREEQIAFEQNTLYETWAEMSWDRIVGAPENCYEVKVEFVAQGKLDRRGILFKAYTW